MIHWKTYWHFGTPKFCKWLSMAPRHIGWEPLGWSATM